ncbi:MAG TPA: hypothetical protein VGL26_10215 [Jatrophihabitans sp.]
MFATLLSQLRRLDGRPRKFAATGCLILAAVSVLTTGARPRTAPPPRAPAPGEVALALTLADGGAGRGFLQPGDHVDLLSSTDGLSLPDVLVLGVSTKPASGSLLNSSSSDEDGTGAGTAIVIAVDVSGLPTATALASRRVVAAPHAPN